MDDKWNWKLGLETIHLVHFQNYGEQELLAPREISHSRPPPPPQEWMRVDGLSRESFTLLSYPFNCSPFDLRVEQRGSGAKF